MPRRPVRGEAFSGNLQGVEQGAVIVLGTGVGSGYILDGKLRRGLNHQSGEVSSAIQDRDNAGKESFGGWPVFGGGPYSRPSGHFGGRT